MPIHIKGSDSSQLYNRVFESWFNLGNRKINNENESFPSLLSGLSKSKSSSMAATMSGSRLRSRPLKEDDNCQYFSHAFSSTRKLYPVFNNHVLVVTVRKQTSDYEYHHIECYASRGPPDLVRSTCFYPCALYKNKND